MIESRKAVGRAASRARLEGRERDARDLEAVVERLRIAESVAIRQIALHGYRSWVMGERDA